MYCLLYIDDFRKLSDYVAPCVYSVMTFVKIGCTFWGCCYGAPDEHGIWNEMLGYKTFPVQLYDAISSFCIVLICFYLLRRFKDKYEGYIYPIGGMLFAITKGFWECFREHDSIYERNYLNTGWTLWQFWLLALFIGCCIWIILLIRADKVQAVVPSRTKMSSSQRKAKGGKTKHKDSGKRKH